MAREIGIFLFSDTWDGLVECRVEDRRPRVYKIPREKLKSEEVKEIDELKQEGIYFLIGKDENNEKII